MIWAAPPTQVVSITLANVDDAAVITGDISFSGNEGDAVAGDLNATDVDGLTDGTYFTVTLAGHQRHRRDRCRDRRLDLHADRCELVRQRQLHRHRDR